MDKAYIGIDNGVTGTIAIIHPSGSTDFFKTPVRLEQDYTKKKQNVSRVNITELERILNTTIGDDVKVIIERPMVNPGMFRATLSAVRCLEATLCVLESLGLSHEYIDSKKWQKVFLPIGCKGKELKAASMQAAIRLFPKHKEMFEKQKDGDGMLIAEYARRLGL